MLVERILAAASGDPIAVSHAIDPALRSALLTREGTCELPCVRGRTVVPGAWRGAVVVGHPNYLGVFDQVRHRRIILLTGRWAELRPISAGPTIVPVEGPVSKTDSLVALEEARRLVKRLRQVRGVHVAIRPQSPVIIALLPNRLHAGAPPPPGTTALGGEFPEYPGGVRIELPEGESRGHFDRYAAGVEQFVAKEA